VRGYADRLIGGLAAAGVAVAAGLMVAARLDFSGVWLPLVLTATACLALVVWGLVVDRDTLSPGVLFGLTFFVLYVLRPLYIISSGRWGPTRQLDDRSVASLPADALARTSWIAFLGVGMLAVAYVFHRGRAISAGPEDRRRSETPQLRLVNLRLAIVLTGGLAAYAYWSLIRQTGGFQAYLTALSARGGFFFGRAYIVMVGFPLKIVTLVFVATLLSRRRLARRHVWVAGFLVVAVSVGDFLTGGRAGLLLGTLLPVLLIRHYLRSRVRLLGLATCVAVGLVLFVGSRVVTRDAVYAHESRAAVFVSAIRHIPTTTVGGREAIDFDSLLTLVSQPSLRRARGGTYIPILTFPIPRAVWANKPAGGGDTWFTETYFPEYYATGGHTETSISFIGEAYANFGVAGVLFGSLLVGMLLSFLYTRFVEQRDVRGVVLYSITVGYVLTLLRGDAFHSVTSAVVSIVLACCVWPLVVFRPGRAAEEEEWSHVGLSVG
jgi:hypothetical protein